MHQMEEDEMANKDLDLKNLHELNDPLKYGLACLLIICILGLGYIFFFKDQLAELDVAKEKEISLKETFRQKSIQAANLNNLKLELEALRASFNQLLKQLPTDKEIPNLIQELHQAASKNGLQLSGLSPLEPVNDGAIQRLPYNLSISGQYDQVSKFARDIGELSRIITLSQLNIKKDDKTGLITLDAIANTYKARPAADLEAERKQLEVASASAVQ